MNSIVKRALTGIVYIALVLAGILIPDWWALSLLGIILMVPSVTEFSRMFLSDPHLNASVKTENYVSSRKVQPTPDEPIRPIVIVDAVFFSLLIICSNIIMTISPALKGYAVASFVVFGLYLLFRLYYTINDLSGNPLLSWGKCICALMYIVFPIALMPVLNSNFLTNILLIIFIMIWCNDTGAFLIGCWIGRHKMCPRLSPKKTWEGFFGGLVFSVLAGIIWSIYEEDSMLTMIIFGIVMSISATYGDLFESMIKRRAAVKDSGAILPGHGGMLDRIDSLLFCIPTAMVFFLIKSMF